MRGDGERLAHWLAPTETWHDRQSVSWRQYWTWACVWGVGNEFWVEYTPMWTGIPMGNSLLLSAKSEGWVYIWLIRVMSLAPSAIAVNIHQRRRQWPLYYKRSRQSDSNSQAPPCQILRGRVRRETSGLASQSAYIWGPPGLTRMLPSTRNRIYSCYIWCKM